MLAVLRANRMTDAARALIMSACSRAAAGQTTAQSLTAT
jgi:hypothetical protein